MNNQNDPLETLLRSLRDRDEARPRESFRTNARIRILNTMSKPAASPVPPRFRFQFFSYATLVMLFFLLSGTGVVYASQRANPGDRLYPVKLASEQVALTVSPGGSPKTAVAVTIIGRRAGEIEHAKSKGNAAEVKKAVSNFDTTVSRIQKNHRVKQDDVDREVSKYEELIRDEENENPEEENKPDARHEDRSVRGVYTTATPAARPAETRPAETAHPETQNSKQNSAEEHRDD